MFVLDNNTRLDDDIGPKGTIENDFAARAVGVSVCGSAAEVCVMSPRGTVELHGWFPKAVMLTMLNNRPPCHIAFVGEPLPHDAIAGLWARGHASIHVSKRGMARAAQSGHVAADACRVALHHAATFAAAELHQAA
jgi:hypothetical protein